MRRDLAKSSAKHFQILIVGGGITGACLAHDAVLRGLSVLLVERDDFGAATSAASSKLLHGGIRYLPHGQVWKVRESFRESCIFQHLAPHATSWVPFLVPTERGTLMKSGVAMRVAMLLYRACGAGLRRAIADPGKLPPKALFLNREATLREAPMLAALPDLSGAQVLWESHMYNAERMPLAFLKTAVAGGAEAANAAEAVRLLLGESGRRVCGAMVRDRLSGREYEIRADLVINAAGPFVQGLNDTAPQLRLAHQLTGFSRGVHLVTRQVHPHHALTLSTRKKTTGLVSRGGRHLFIIPWRGCSLIGTTNVPFSGTPSDLRVTDQDINDFLTDLNEALPSLNLTREDVRYAFTGLYPLVAREIKADTYQGTGAYQIVDHEASNGVAGIMTVLGAKFTTARRLAEQGIDAAMKKLGLPDPGCRTADTPLLEGRIESLDKFTAVCKARYGALLPESTLDAILKRHGAETPTLIEEGERLGLLDPIMPGRNVTVAEIDWAVDREMALTLDDVVFGRTGLGDLGPVEEAVLRRCAGRMAGPLGWDEAEIQRQIARVQRRYEWH